jgi:aminopeptidase N
MRTAVRPFTLFFSALALVAFQACERASAPIAGAGAGVGGRPEKRLQEPHQDLRQDLRQELREGEALRDAREFAVQARGEASSDTRSRAENAEFPPIDVTSYHLRGSFDWETQTLDATVDVALTLGEPPVASAKPAPAATAAMGPKRVVLDAAVDRVHSVTLGEGQGPSLAFTHDTASARLEVLLPESLATRDVVLRVQYRARESGSLRAIEARAGDPVNVPVVYTTSEPLGAARWMPCNNTPSDRARFSVTLTSARGERLVANGRLVDESVDDKGTRTTTWATDEGIPTYLMAFAAGAFEVAETRVGDLPVSVWARRGVRFDGAGLLAMLRDQMTRFEELLVPYPFEKYSVVLLPDFPAGGIEHASVTFQRETRSTEASIASDVGLHAHELAHQWFGDYVTVANWDELWIKEGMATLLAAEALRAFDAPTARRGLLGQSFAFGPTDAIRDTSLAPGAKYTSGPYERSAWFFTQARSLMGERAFWRAARDLLLENAWGTLDAEKVLARFERDLGGAFVERARVALAAKDAPFLAYQPPIAPGNAPRLTLVDRAGALLAPLVARVVDATGTRSQQVDLLAGSSFELPADDMASAGGGDVSSVSNAVASDNWLQLDPAVVHPALDTIWLRDATLAETPELARALAPKTPAHRDSIGELPPQSQNFLLRADLMGALTPSLLVHLFPSLDGDSPATAALGYACRRHAETGLSGHSLDADKSAWRSVVQEVALARTFRGYERRGPGYVACADALAPLVEGNARRVLARPDLALLSDPELLNLSLTYFEPTFAPELWRGVALRGPTLRAREIALATLAKYLTDPSLAVVGADATSVWSDFLSQALTDLPAQELTSPALDIADGMARRGLGDNRQRFVESLAAVFDVAQSSGLQRRATCIAWRQTLGAQEVEGGQSPGNVPAAAPVPAPAAAAASRLEAEADALWDAYVARASASPWLDPSVRALLAAPESCRAP